MRDERDGLLLRTAGGSVASLGRHSEAIVAAAEVVNFTGGSSGRGRWSHLWALLGELAASATVSEPVPDQLAAEAADFSATCGAELSASARSLLAALAAAGTPTPGSRDAVASRWDDHLREWLAGNEALDPELKSWWESYRGRGAGGPTRDAFPEPYVGPLIGQPRLVMLGLNPGPPDLDFQSRGGRFAQEIADSSYSAWAASDPYGSEAWETGNVVNPSGRGGRRPNRYRTARVTFARHWLDDPVDGQDLLTVELYPWHSERVTAPIRPPHSVLQAFVWQPLTEIDTDVVFAFGKPWIGVASTLGLAQRWLRQPGDGAFDSRARGAAGFELPSGQILTVSWQSGYAGPPGAADTQRLRTLVESCGRTSA